MAEKVAVITGGAAGIGQAVVQALVARGNWHVHVVDLAPPPTSSSPSITYHKANTTDYASLGAAFRAVYQRHRRLDFVFANAGILERANWFAASADPEDPPPEPDWTAMEVNLKGCMNTARIGRHYMALSPGEDIDEKETGEKETGEKEKKKKDRGAIVVTSSSAGIWPTFCAPVYTASKHGVVGFMRSVADWYWTSDGIRVNALCPSTVRTNIVPEGGWDGFPDKVFTPFEVVVGVVMKMVDGEVVTDSAGRTARDGKNYGQCVVPSAEKFYLSDMPPFLDETHEGMVTSTHVEKMVGILI